MAQARGRAGREKVTTVERVIDRRETHTGLTRGLYHGDYHDPHARGVTPPLTRSVVNQ